MLNARDSLKNFRYERICLEILRVLSKVKVLANTDGRTGEWTDELRLAGWTNMTDYTDQSVIYGLIRHCILYVH